MSTYPYAENLLLTCARAVGGGATYTEANSAVDYYQVLDSGAEVILVVRMGGDTVEGDQIDGYGVQGMYQERHVIDLEVFVPIGTGETGYEVIDAGLKARVEALKDWIRAHDRLSDPAETVRMARPERTRKPETVTRSERSGGSFRMQVVSVKVWCEAAYPESEGGW